MGAVRHQTLCPHFERGGAATLRQQIAIDRLIAGFEQDRLTAVATLGRVEREAGDDDATNAPHAHMKGSLGSMCNKLSP
jgi:hypothetical protein